MRMKRAHWIRSLLFTAGLAFCAQEVRSDDILANGNFSDGKAHWKGDGKDASGTSIDDMGASMSSQGSASGMAVSLKGGITYISQVFHSAETALTLSITYKTTADFATTGRARSGRSGGTPGGPPQPGGFPGGPGGGSMGFGGALTAILGFPVQGQLPMPGKDQAVALIADPSPNALISSLIPLPASPDAPHTSTIVMDQLMAHEEKTLYIFLPPGTGDITFSNISLVKPDTAPAASGNPFQQ